MKEANRRVCFVAPFGLRQKTTLWARTLPLAQQLVVRGWSATLVIPPWDSPQDGGQRWDERGVEVVNVALGGGTLAVLRRLLRTIDRLQPGIVHIIKPRAHAGLIQWWLWQRRNRKRAGPLILLDSDDWEQAWAPVNHYAALLARFLAWQEEWGIRHADGITAASHWLVDRLQMAAPHIPRLYLPNGVAVPASEGLRWQAQAQRDVLFFSRFVEVAPAWLALFVQALHSAAPGARLRIAGTPVQPGLEDAYHRAVAAVAASGAAPVDWLGYVQGSELEAIYRCSGCAIFPAEAVPLQQAKCSVRLATTLLAGMPVVASAVGEQAAYGAEGAALLVPAGATPHAFAAAVASVLAAPAEQAALSQRARARLLQRYDWASLGAQLDTFYRQVQEAE